MLMERDYYDEEEEKTHSFSMNNHSYLRMPGVEVETDPFRPSFGIFITTAINKPFYRPYLSICLIWIQIKIGFL